MPLYEYECSKCKTRHERLVSRIPKSGTRSYVRCDECGSRMKRVISASNFSVSGYSAKTHYGLRGKETKQ